MFASKMDSGWLTRAWASQLNIHMIRYASGSTDIARVAGATLMGYVRRRVSAR